MSKPIPLSTALRVEAVFVIVGHVLQERLDLVLKGFASESGNLGDVQWQAESAVLAEEIAVESIAVLERYHLSGLDFGSSGLDSCRSQQVQSTQLSSQSIQDTAHL